MDQVSRGSGVLADIGNWERGRGIANVMGGIWADQFGRWSFRGCTTGAWIFRRKIRMRMSFLEFFDLRPILDDRRFAPMEFSNGQILWSGNILRSGAD